METTSRGNVRPAAIHSYSFTKTDAEAPHRIVRGYAVVGGSIISSHHMATRLNRAKVNPGRLLR